ncbi:hypothetical protein [Streptomyces natalensis]|uniref:hypothetical protein n=1 Tax=Streptomyces natalensis TaxID=68242 RepID=UPI000A4BE8BC|nr:hypothetical protein [Streptomyces natalensis]
MPDTARASTRHDLATDDTATDGRAADAPADSGFDSGSDAGSGADAGYCEAPTGAAHRGAAGGPPYADCVQCGEPTEYPAARPGALLCPVCEWQEAQRSACSG